jgi:hypothetical protein
MTTALRDFLEIPYDQLEELNLGAKQQRLDRTPVDTIREERMRYLHDEQRIKAVTVCFTDLEGRLHMLDYDKKFLLRSADALTFDGSSIRGFARQAESDLRLAIDWAAFYSMALQFVALRARLSLTCDWQLIGRLFIGCPPMCLVSAKCLFSALCWNATPRSTQLICAPN